MGFIKNQKLGFYAYAAVCVMALVSLLMYVSNVNAPYYEDMNGTVVLMMGIAMALVLAVLILPQLLANRIVQILCDGARVAIAALVILSGVTFIGMRVASFGYIFGSNLEMGNDAALSAGNQAVWVIILFVVTWILSLFASFFEVNRKKA